MVKRLMWLSAGLLVIALAGIVLYMNRPEVPVSAKYPPMNIESLSKQADVVVEGVVVKRGASQVTKIPTVIPDGQFAEFPETPIEIRIVERIKGKDTPATVTYWEAGGDFPTKKMIPEGGQLQPGDKVLLFLNEAGHSWDPRDSVLRIVDDKVTVRGEPATDLAKMKQRVRDHMKE